MCPPTNGMGREVAGRVLLATLGHVRGRGIPIEPLLAGLPFGLETLRQRDSRIDWEAFLVFWGRVEAALGGLVGMEQLGMDLVQRSLALNLLGRLFVTPAQLYLQLAPRISSKYYTCLSASARELEGGRLCYEGRAFAGYTMPLSFGAASLGLMRAYPRMLGLAEAHVEGDYDPQSFCFRITPPPARTLLGSWTSHFQPLPPPLEAGEDFEAAAPEDLADLIEQGPGRTIGAVGARLQEAGSAEEVAAAALDILERQMCCRHATIWLRTGDGGMAVIGSRSHAGCHSSSSRLLEVGKRVVGRVDADAAVLGPASPVQSDLEVLLPWVGMALARWLEPDPDGDRAVADLARRTGLTSREAEILKWLRMGKTNPEIALICDISPRTVQKHVEHVLVKVGVETRQAAAMRTYIRS